jgi:TonB family protein
MVRWFRPEYRIEQALAGMEGSVVLDLVIDPSGQPIQRTVAQSSGSAELDEATLRAAEIWRFAPPSRKSGALDVWGRVEVRFNFFSFELSRIGEPLPESSAAIGSRGDSARVVRTTVRERALRRLIDQLQAGLPDRVLVPSDAAERQHLATAAKDWGPVRSLDYLGTVGPPRWRSYMIKPEYRSDPQSGSVAVQWHLYRATHEHRSSLWKVAFDSGGETWALKADAIPPSAASETSTPGK